MSDGSFVEKLRKRKRKNEEILCVRKKRNCNIRKH
jgi:hypothetical protein